MSGQATGWVLRHGPKPTDVDRHGKPYGGRARGLRYVLLTIADAANRDGEHAHPGQAAMAEGSLYGRSQVASIVAELIAEGWAIIEEEGGGRGRATVYRVPFRRRQEPSDDRTVSDNRAIPTNEPPDMAEETARSERETARSPYLDSAPTVYATEQINEQPTTDTRDAFDEFWSVYPRSASVGAARKAWSKALAKVNGDASVLIAAAMRYRTDPNRDPLYTAHAATWLNQERWTDAPLPSRSGRPAPPSQNVSTDREAESGLISMDEIRAAARGE